MKTHLTVAITALLTLIGCTPVATPKPEAHFGEAVAHNIAVQTVNPNAPMDKRPIAFDAQHQALAQARYEAGKVKEPADMSTSRIEVTGSGGGDDGGSK